MRALESLSAWPPGSVRVLRIAVGRRRSLSAVGVAVGVAEGVGVAVGIAVTEGVGVAVGVGVATGVFISVWISAGLRARSKIFTSSMRPSKTFPGAPGFAAIQNATPGSTAMGPLFGVLPTSTPSW